MLVTHPPWQKFRNRNYLAIANENQFCGSRTGGWLEKGMKIHQRPPTPLVDPNSLHQKTHRPPPHRLTTHRYLVAQFLLNGSLRGQ